MGAFHIQDKDNKDLAFVSYAHEDKPFVDEICEFIDSLDTGIVIWKDDRSGLIPGQYHVEEIGENISKAKFFFIFLTKDSLKAKYVSKEIRLAVSSRIYTGQPIIIPILINLKQRDVPRKFALYDTMNIPIKNKSKDKMILKNKLKDLLDYYNYITKDALLRFGKGVISCDRSILSQVTSIESNEMTKGNYFILPFSCLGTPSLVKVIDSSTELELDTKYEKILSENKIKISLKNEIKKKELEIIMETPISKATLEQIVKVEKHVNKKEIFGYQADIIIRNLSEFYIENYQVVLTFKQIKLGIAHAKKEEEMKRMRRKDQQKEKIDMKLRKLIEKHNNLEFSKFSMFQFLGKSLFDIIPHEKTFPIPKNCNTRFPSIDSPGRFQFEIDLKPEETISYGITGMELTELSEEIEKEFIEKTIRKFTKPSIKKK